MHTVKSHFQEEMSNFFMWIYVKLLFSGIGKLLSSIEEFHLACKFHLVTPWENEATRAQTKKLPYSSVKLGLM